MADTLENIVKDNVYRPNRTITSAPLSPKYCAQSVHETGRGVGFHQCDRKAVVQLGGYGWCTQHANQIKSRAGLLDVSESYSGGVNQYGSPYLLKITDDGVRVTSKTLFGSDIFVNAKTVQRVPTFELAVQQIEIAAQEYISKREKEICDLRDKVKQVKKLQ